MLALLKFANEDTVDKEKKIVSLSVRVPKETKSKFKTRVFERGQTLSHVILGFIKDYLKDTDPKDKQDKSC